MLPATNPSDRTGLNLILRQAVNLHPLHCSEKLELLDVTSKNSEWGLDTYEMTTFKTNAVMKLALQQLTIFHCWNVDDRGHCLNGHQKSLKTSRPAFFKFNGRENWMSHVVSTRIRR
jgi:hypothetical protein